MCGPDESDVTLLGVIQPHRRIASGLVHKYISNRRGDEPPLACRPSARARTCATCLSDARTAFVNTHRYGVTLWTWFDDFEIYLRYPQADL
jgi:hypothetical protein